MNTRQRDLRTINIQAIESRLLETPFQRIFSHASATRACAHSIIVSLTSSEGLKGYGEGCPRVYVTAEDSSASFDFINSKQKQLSKIGSLDQLIEFSLANRASIDRSPAAWCAFELAFLDLLGKLNQQTIDQVLGLPPVSPPFHYSAILGIQEVQAFSKSVQQYHKMGMHDFKLKVSGISAEDAARVAVVAETIKPRAGHSLRLRIDANNLWECSEEVCELIKSLTIKPWAIEEPFKDREDFKSMQRLAQRLGVKIILDEAVCTVETLAKLPVNAECWVANVRISKCGGLLRSIELVRELIKQKVGIIVGAHVGETSILTRAAISLVNAFRSVVLAQEGALGTYLLSKDIVAEPLMFAESGALVQHSSFGQAGLGLL